MTEVRFGKHGVLETVGGRLVCHVCGRDYLSLQSHVWGAHGYTAQQYREEFGLYPTLPLWAEDVSAKLTASNVRRMKVRPDELVTMSRKALGYRPIPNTHPAIRARISENNRRWWAHQTPEKRREVGERLGREAAEWLDRHPEERQRRADQMRQLGTGHKWGVLGEANPRARLDAAKVRAIRKERGAGVSLDELAERFGVSRGTIWLVEQRKTWGHVR